MTSYSRIGARLFGLFAAVLLLSACGSGSDDFSLEIGRDEARVSEALGGVRLDSTIGTLFPGRKLSRSTPGSNEILYTIGGSEGETATIRFRLEPVEGKKATLVNVAVDVPEVVLDIDGEKMELSELKVVMALRFVLDKLGGKLNRGESVATETTQLSRLMSILAVLTDHKATEKAKAMANDPTLMLEQFAMLGGAGGESGNGLRAQSDPDLELREREGAARREQYQAAMPMDAATGVKPTGEPAMGNADQSGGWGSNN